MIPPMTSVVTQLKVWIDCPACGRLEKLAREIVLPPDLATPMLEKTGAVCERCRGSAVMYFERSVGRLH